MATRTIIFTGQTVKLTATDEGKSQTALKRLYSQASANRDKAAFKGDDSSVDFWEGLRCRTLTTIIENRVHNRVRRKRQHLGCR